MSACFFIYVVNLWPNAASREAWHPALRTVEVVAQDPDAAGREAFKREPDASYAEVSLMADDGSAGDWCGEVRR